MSDLIKSIKISIVGGKATQLAVELGINPVALDLSDVALFLVSANDGIVSADLEKWRLARELYIPSLVIICDLTVSEIDFERYVSYRNEDVGSCRYSFSCFT